MNVCVCVLCVCVCVCVFIRSCCCLRLDWTGICVHTHVHGMCVHKHIHGVCVHTHIQNRSVGHTIKWLTHVVCLPEYADKFKEHKISGEKLVHLHELSLVSDLEITAHSHAARISNFADKAIACSLIFSELHFRRTFFDSFERQNKTAFKLERQKMRRNFSVSIHSSLHMKHQAIKSPRIWSTRASTDPTALGATVQPHFLLDMHGGVDVGVRPLVKTEEQHSGHSFDEVGCLCEHNWVCGNCFAWNRGTHSE